MTSLWKTKGKVWYQENDDSKLGKNMGALMEKQYKATAAQKKLLDELRKEVKEGKITIEEGHKQWRKHPDYIKQYGEDIQ